MLATSYNPPGSDYRRRRRGRRADRDGGRRCTIQYAGTMVATRYEFSLWVEGSDGDLWTDRRRVWWRQRGRRFFRPLQLGAGAGGRRGALPQGRDRVAAQPVSRRPARGQVLGDQRAPTTCGRSPWSRRACARQREGRRVEIAEVFAPELQARARQASRQERRHDRSEPRRPERRRVLFVGLDAG